MKNQKSGLLSNARGEWYVIIQLILLALIVFGPRNLPNSNGWPTPWDTVGVILGLIFGLLGGLLGLAGVMSLGSNLTAVPHPKDDASHVQSGAYKFVRHPIYSGIILAAIGFAFVTNGTLTFLYILILFLFFDIKSRREEEWLTEKFPTYPAYQKQVRKLIPFIY
jgi:protein-S-isoprenylcysteine O-methyltransferase Ste14